MAPTMACCTDSMPRPATKKIAYVPSFLFNDSTTPANPNTTNGPHQLTNKSYSHRYYVDAPPTAADAYGAFTSGTCVSPGCWRTVLVGGVGHGGKGYYALDITDPTGAKTATAALAFNEGNAANIALWEFTDSASGDMGFTYGQATIARVKTGASTTAWAAIFGNGYNSANERARSCTWCKHRHRRRDRQDRPARPGARAGLSAAAGQS